MAAEVLSRYMLTEGTVNEFINDGANLINLFQKNSGNIRDFHSGQAERIHKNRWNIDALRDWEITAQTILGIRSDSESTTLLSKFNLPNQKKEKIAELLSKAVELIHKKN